MKDNRYGKILAVALGAAWLLVAGCVTMPGLRLPDDASQWTIELTSTNGLPNGPCAIFDQLDRKMLEGNLAEGKMDGIWRGYASTGDKVIECSYRAGVRNGPVKMWYGPFAYPEAVGRLNVEGEFVDGAYSGLVKSYYTSGVKMTLREYDHGTLMKCRYLSAEGWDYSFKKAMAEGRREDKADLVYLASQDDIVTRSLAQARRVVRQ